MGPYPHHGAGAALVRQGGSVMDAADLAGSLRRQIACAKQYLKVCDE